MTITKEDSKILKGIALIMMLVLHLFLHPEWHVCGVEPIASNQILYVLKEPMRICISIFAFLTGWGYACKGEYTIRYSFRKLISFFVDYWFVYAILLMLALVTKSYEGGYRTSF